ncbi:phosphoesterase [Desulfuromonas sp. KJ2020]|uniref:tyrosine-protein phosphatase n=1 Tax=Desulfuromonas sp. KJ2020 TaxID=2919173 RepID=UPI0020A7EBD0|nr:CpsB/CapC family capsule biosynthesis tyrosine phosphatase [Desulfuromonas sp. KJ2020]MCP3177484.1 phosphoesterase [Desulfuromonas sp. KJ2020]
MIDYHCHLLPGLDDGCQDLAEAVELARLLVGAGFRQIYCTPHCIRGVYDNTPSVVQAAVAVLQQELDRQGIVLRLHAGMEYYLDEYFPRLLSDLQPLGDTGMVLVESPSQAEGDALKEAIFAIVRKGLTPLFAHPERYGFLALPASGSGLLHKVKTYFSGATSDGEAGAHSLIGDLQRQGCLFQGNIGSFAGHYGSSVAQRARQLQQRQFYYCFGSDSHRPDSAQRILAAVPDVLGLNHGLEERNSNLAADTHR